MRRQRLGRNFAQLGVASLFGSLLGLATSAYLGRVLGVSGFGVLSLGRTTIDYILLPLSLGITAVGSARSRRPLPIASKSSPAMSCWPER